MGWEAALGGLQLEREQSSISAALCMFNTNQPEQASAKRVGSLLAARVARLVQRHWVSPNVQQLRQGLTRNLASTALNMLRSKSMPTTVLLMRTSPLHTAMACLSLLSQCMALC